jgi:tRNA(Ile)-lysidine synthase
MQELKAFKDKVRIIFPDYGSFKLLIAVSGGPDSMALLHFFHQEGCEVLAAHVNYGLRGQESDRDEYFVKSYCKENKIECVCLNAKQKIKNSKHNIQETARSIRYEFFEEIRKNYHLDFILTAHHANDNAETVIFNLLRGSGLQGVQGIPSYRGKIIRPFLLLTKNEILRYVETNQIPYVTDLSNLKGTYTRNRIRKKILPEMELENSHATIHLSRSAFLISGYAKWIEQYFNQLKRKLIKKKEKQFEISIPEKLGRAQKICLLYDMLSDYGFNSHQIFQLSLSIDFPDGQEFDSENYLLKVLPKKLLLVKKTKFYDKDKKIITDGLDGEWPDFVEARVTRKIPVNLKTDKFSALIPIEKLAFPLIWRHPVEGDSFKPFGMKGTKKISDFLKDVGVKSPHKESVWLLTDKNGKIVWVVGLRMDEAYRIKGHENQFLKLKVKMDR